MGKGSDNNLSSGVIAALPNDPDQQLAVAQQITQYAVSGRVAKLEAETASLRSKVSEKDAVIGSLQKRVIGAETTLAETSAKLAVAMEGQVLTETSCLTLPLLHGSSLVVESLSLKDF